MASNYLFSLSLQAIPLLARSADRARSAIIIQGTDGTIYVALTKADLGRVGLFQVSGSDGIVDDQATINTYTEIEKGVGILPDQLISFQATDGTRWIAVAVTGSNRVSLYQIAGTNGIISNSATIAANPLLTKNVGTSPRSLTQFAATDGTRWIATSDGASNRVSLFQISGTDGIVDDQSTITANTLITKTVGTSPREICQFVATDGVIWLATADYSSNRVSLFQISGTDGIIYDQAGVTASTVLTKTVGTNPFSVIQFQATDGIRWIATADDNSSRISLFQISGTDGIVDDQSTITANTLITKSTITGGRPQRVIQFQVVDGTRWMAVAELAANAISLFQIAGTDGIVDGQATITANGRFFKNVGVTPWSIFGATLANGSFWVITGNNNSNNFSLFPLTGANGFNLIPNRIDFSTSVTSPLVTSPNTAVLAGIIDYFNFTASITTNGVLFAFPFNYIFDSDDGGTIGNGAALRLTNSSADITNSGGITVANGGTVRLGKKATYVIDFFFQNGSTLEVFPDSDRSGDPVDLSNCTFAATTTVNATSGTATVLVASGAGNISAGAGVTIEAPTSEIVLTGIPNVAGALVGVINLTTLVAPSFPAVVAGSATIPTDPAANYLIAVDAPGYQLQRVVLSGATPLFQVELENNRDLYEAGVDISANLLFNYTTFEVTFVWSAGVVFSNANIYRTVEDYLATPQGVFFPNPPRPIRVPGRNFLFFPYDQDADQVNPVRVRPHPDNMGNPRITDVVVILEGSENPQTDIFDFSLAGGKTIFYQTDATVATVSVSGGLSSEDRAVLTTITNQTAPIAELAETLEAPGVFSAEALANAPATGGGLGPEDIGRLERIEQQLIADEKKGASRYQRLLPGTEIVILDKDVAFDPVEGFTITEHEEPPP